MSHSTKSYTEWTTDDFMSFVVNECKIQANSPNYNKIEKVMVENGVSVTDLKGTVTELKDLLGISGILAKRLKSKLTMLFFNGATGGGNPNPPPPPPPPGPGGAGPGQPPSFPNTKFKLSIRGKSNKEHIFKHEFTANDLVSSIAQAYLDEQLGGKFGYKLKKIEIVLGSTILDYDKTLGSYGIVNSQVSLFTLFKTQGGAMAEHGDDDDLDERTIKFQQYGLIKSALPDVLIGYTDDDGVDRALLDCQKHAMAADTMFLYIQSELASKPSMQHIRCPAKDCAAVLGWQRCTQIADMNAAEYKKYTAMMKERALFGMKECPHCQAYCKRDDGVAIFRMRCIACNGSDWCWDCAQPWRGSGMSMCCNQNCQVIIDTNKRLAESPMVKCGNGVDIPVFRACPRCLTMIQYSHACKHMLCTGCDKQFCYICLGLHDKEKGWACGSHSYKCQAAPKQQFK